MRESLRVGIEWWSAWRVRSVSRRIFAASLMVAFLTTLVKLAGAAKVVVVAQGFGTADALDAFLIAFLVPSFLAEVVGASFSAALVPTLIEVRERKGPAAARRLLAGGMALVCAPLGGAALLVVAARGPAVRVLGSGFNSAKVASAEWLLTLMAPLVPLMGVSAIWRSVLNAGERFALPAGIPAITPLATIALLWMLGTSLGAQVLAAGTLLGSTLELAIIGWAVGRQGYSLFPRWRGWDPALRQVLHQYTPMLAGALLTSGALLIDPAMAASLGRGSVSALSYGSKLASVIVAIGPVALGTVALPHFSRMAALGDRGGLRRTAAAYARWILLAGAPLTLLLAVYSEPVVRLMFERGAFTRSDTLLVAGIQRFAVLQLPFAMLGALLARMASSLKANQVLMWAAGISLVVNAGFDYLLMHWWGVAGIALASAVVALVTCGYLAAVLAKRLRAC